MKNTIKFLAAFALLTAGVAQAQVGVGTTTPDPSAVLDVSSTTKGLLLPRLTTAERDAITSPATGLMIYNTTINQTQSNTGTPASPIWSVGGITYANIRGTVASATANYTILPTDHVILSGAAVTFNITLPALTVADAGRIVYVVNANTTATAINVVGQPTVVPVAGQTINQFRSKAYIWTGSAWLLLSPA